MGAPFINETDRVLVVGSHDLSLSHLLKTGSFSSLAEFEVALGWIGPPFLSPNYDLFLDKYLKILYFSYMLHL